MTTNQAFIDGQNLYMAMRADGWALDLRRFRSFLTERYQIKKAYYFIGAYEPAHKRIYQSVRQAGFLLVFREHNDAMMGSKKGNVDTDIVFMVMAKLIDDRTLNKVYLASGDGDYFKMVEYLIRKDRFGKLLPLRRKSTSSLYNRIPDDFIDFLNKPDTKKKICRKAKQN